MIDYYEILEVKPHASLKEIKRSFRNKAKEFHPDLSSHNKKNRERKMRLVLKAYEVLSNPLRREEYDRIIHTLNRKVVFDYRSFLREGDLFSQSKLIFHDLLTNRTTDALDLYEMLTFQPDYQMEKYLCREDYMDCAFLLAEAFENRSNYEKAWDLYIVIYELEMEQPYFKHFIEEVINRLRNIVCVKMIKEFSPYIVIQYLFHLINLNISDKDSAFFYKKTAEVYSEMGKNDVAAEFLHQGLNLNHKLQGIKKLKEKIGYTL